MLLTIVTNNNKYFHFYSKLFKTTPSALIFFLVKQFEKNLHNTTIFFSFSLLERLAVLTKWLLSM